MDDKKAKEIRLKIYKNMTPAQKWEQAGRLRQTAWDMKTAAIRIKHSTWSEEKVQDKVREIFLYATT